MSYWTTGRRGTPPRRRRSCSVLVVSSGPGPVTPGRPSRSRTAARARASSPGWERSSAWPAW